MERERLIEYLDRHYPREAQEDWDNSGLEVGEVCGELNHLLLALDLTEETLERAIELGADFILTHHPMIFKGIKTVTDRTLTGRRILTLVKHGIAYYAMHTNYDILGMADRSAARLELEEAIPITGIPEGEGFGRVGNLKEEMSLRQLSQRVKESFGLKDLRVYGPLEERVKRVAICTGSGKSFVGEVLSKGAQAYITGDIDHHTALDAMAEGLYILDATHYGTEYIFMEDMEKELREAFPELRISRMPVHFPYELL